MLLGALAVLVALFALLWLVWGFRWPPTAEVVTDAEQTDVEHRVELEGADDAPQER